MPQPIALGSHLLGGAYPLICAPIVASDAIAACEQARVLRTTVPGPDIVEIRVDALSADASRDLFSLLADLASILGQHLPLLITVRSAAEGGVQPLELDQRIELLRQAIHSGNAAAIDIELATPSDIRNELIAEARANDVHMIISAHDFNGTPDDTVLLSWLDQLIHAGGEAAKLAVTANTPNDALRLLHTTSMAAIHSPVPLITMAMGAAGTITRLAGPFFGSALSFASLGVLSAPGQLPLSLVRSYWHEAGVRKD
jgi:3-dehydroquinate dehydratase I